MTKAYKVIYYPAAMKDITSILDYISMDAPNSANNLIDKIDEAISSLSSFPNKGVRPKDFNLKSKGYRMLIIDSYIVFYLVNDESFKVEIMRAISSKQNYKTFL